MQYVSRIKNLFPKEQWKTNQENKTFLKITIFKDWIMYTPQDFSINAMTWFACVCMYFILTQQLFWQYYE